MNRLARIAWVLAAAVAFTAAQSSPAASGVTASGTVVLHGPHGGESGTITVAAWGTTACKITIQLGPALRHRQVTATSVGQRTVVTGPAGLVAAVPLPLGARLGCALLPEGLAYAGLAAGATGGATLSADAAGRPQTLAWTEHGQPASLSYASYQVSGGLLLPGTVTEAVAGVTRLAVQFSSITPETFTAADFPLPPAPSRPASANPGGAQ